jgi:hypothetical protein
MMMIHDNKHADDAKHLTKPRPFGVSEEQAVLETDEGIYLFDYVDPESGTFVKLVDSTDPTVLEEYNRLTPFANILVVVVDAVEHGQPGIARPAAANGEIELFQNGRMSRFLDIEALKARRSAQRRRRNRKGRR